VLIYYNLSGSAAAVPEALRNSADRTGNRRLTQFLPTSTIAA